MRIAVPFQNGQVFQHFGHTEQFKIYDTDGNTVTSSMVMDTHGQGHGALAGFLGGLKVDTLICGGIGGGARKALEEAGIQLYGGVTGGADEAVQALLEGKLVYNPDVRCQHHGEEGHDCNSHTDGSCSKHGEHHCHHS